MRTSFSGRTLPEVRSSLKKLGVLIQTARRRRKLTRAEVAKRLNIGEQTVVRIERGDSSVGVAATLSVLWLLELDKQLVDSISPDSDKKGLALELARLPARVRTKKASAGYDY